MKGFNTCGDASRGVMALYNIFVLVSIVSCIREVRLIVEARHVHCSVLVRGPHPFDLLVMIKGHYTGADSGPVFSRIIPVCT